MTLGDMVRTALSNLGRRKVRTVLTAVGVIVGILTIVTMVSLGIGVRLELNKQFAAIGLERVFVRPSEGERNFFTQFQRPDRTKPITTADVERWRALPGVVDVEPDVNLPTGVGGQITIAGQTTVAGIGGGDLFTAPFVAPPTALVGDIELPADGSGVVLHQDTLDRMGITVEQVRPLIGQPLDIVLETPQGTAQTFSPPLLGVSTAESPQIEVSLQDRIAMKSWWYNQPDLLETDGYDVVVLRGENTSVANNLVTQIEGEGFDVQSLQILLSLADQVFSIINIMLSSVGGLALFVASLGIVNTMIMSIYERTREIGTLKAIGASRGDIRLMFMIEAGMIGLLGGVVGLVLGWILGRVLDRAILWYIIENNLPIRGTFFVVTPTLALAALAFALFVGVAAGLYPANRAARLDPLVALRHE